VVFHGPLPYVVTTVPSHNLRELHMINIVQMPMTSFLDNTTAYTPYSFVSQTPPQHMPRSLRLYSLHREHKRSLVIFCRKRFVLVGKAV
jgi:hypothetical protein